jgi:hypothetical protein
MRFVHALGLGLVAAALGCSSYDPIASPRQISTEPQQRALASLTDWRSLPVLGRSRHVEQSSEDRGNRQPPSTLFEHGNIDANNFVCRSHDARLDDRQSFFLSFDEPACTDAGVRGVVLTRFLGRGHLSRLWLTSLVADPTLPAGESLRVYVDDEPHPRIDVPLANARDGSAGEIFSPPFAAAASYDLAWYYPLVFEQRLVIALDDLRADTLYFHQTGVVLEPGASQPQPADAVAHDELTVSQAGNALAALQANGVDGSLELVPTSALQVAAASTLPIAALSGPTTIQELRVRLHTEQRARAAELRFTARWDGAVLPAIDVPLLELFGSALDALPHASIALAGRVQDDSIELRLRLPMPFSQGAELALHNPGAEPVSVEVALLGEPGVPPPNWGHLHVQRHQTLPPASASHTLLRATGPGKLVGVCVMLEGHALPDGTYQHPMVFLEGDVRAMADGHRVLAGTGTEDYFDSAFYFAGTPQATPFAQDWGVISAGASGRASACRWHVLGSSIDFASEIDVSLEVGPGRGDVLDRYRSVAFYYQ